MRKKQTFSPLREAYRVATIEDEDSRLKDAERLAGIIHANLHKVGCELVTGEQGELDWAEATRRLMGRACLHPIEAQMLAEVVAAGVASAHELATTVVITADAERKLAMHLSDRALGW